MTYEDLADEINKRFNIDTKDDPEALLRFFQALLDTVSQTESENEDLQDDNSQLIQELISLM